MTAASRINIRRTPKGVTIRATGGAAQALFDAITRAAHTAQKTLDCTWPNGATVKLCWSGSGGYPTVGWAKRGPAGELLSAHSGTPLDADCWDVVEERKVM